MNWFEIASIIGTFSIVYFTWRQAKMTATMRRETAPLIANIESKGKNIFKVFITNSKPHNIALQDVFVKEKIFWFIYSKHLKVKWKPQTKSGDAGGPKLLMIGKPLSQFNENDNVPQYAIKDQYEFHMTIPSYHEGSTYKIFVRTTGGLCQSICPPSRKLQSEASELESGERRLPKSDQKCR